MLKAAVYLFPAPFCFPTRPAPWTNSAARCCAIYRENEDAAQCSRAAPNPQANAGERGSGKATRRFCGAHSMILSGLFDFIGFSPGSVRNAPSLKDESGATFLLANRPEKGVTWRLQR